ncbi:putative protein phosphatase tag-83 [Bienertia sinuspersici]
MRSTKFELLKLAQLHQRHAIGSSQTTAPFRTPKRTQPSTGKGKYINLDSPHPIHPNNSRRRSSSNDVKIG